MNDLLKKKIQPIINTAVGLLDEYIIKAVRAVKTYEVDWGIVPDQPLLDKDIQRRVRRLIKGEIIKNPTDIELKIAGIQLDIAISKARQ